MFMKFLKITFFVCIESRRNDFDFFNVHLDREISFGYAVVGVRDGGPQLQQRVVQGL
jgi:hypothetical protein